MREGMYRTLLCTLLVILLWGGAIAGFALQVSNYKLDDRAKADGIVVLTGGGGRIEYGLDLLLARRGKALFISGVGGDAALPDLIAKMPPRLHNIVGILSGGTVTLEREAPNTIGNARNSAEWIKQRKFHSILLVTADYHLPRAIAEFEAILPRDVAIIPAPVKTRDYADFSWLADGQAVSLIVGEFHKLAAAKLRHLFIEANSHV